MPIKRENGTIVYSFKEAIEKLKKIEKPELALDELILLTIGLIDKPVNGRVVMQKEVFLLYQELKDKVRIMEPDFKKYKYGPFSFTISALLELLESSGYLEIRNRRSTRSTKYMLTEKGKEIAKRIIAMLEKKLGPDYIEKLRKLRMGWDQLGHDGILRYVYQKYPQYREKSEVKEKYIHIDWGVLEA